MSRAGIELPDALESGLRRIARAPRLLVASDFDGTLADIVDHPDAVTADAAAVAALRDLADLPGTRVAVISGREVAVLRAHLGHAGFTLVGSHGAEIEDPNGRATAPSLDEATAADLDEAERRLRQLARGYEGALVERKPTGVAFHYRQVDRDRRPEASREAEGVARDSGTLRSQPGHMVLELLAGDVTKGEALDALRLDFEVDATLFVGDDRTDEFAFGRLGPDDLSVKIGPGTTNARVRVASRAEVAPLFRRLEELRRE